MKSQGEIEAAVCDGISKFHQEFIGRGPQDIRSHLIDTLLVVRLHGALSAAERQLLLSPDGPSAGSANGHNGAGNGSEANGRSLLKQVRSHMVAIGRMRLVSIVQEAAGVPPVSVHHDISTVTGEEVIVFSLAEAPECRPKRPARRP
jgi:uncharacterized protein YbcI